ncbi:hypothetical protein C0075_14860 [Rhizobium sp. KAs_5_22]|uniref:hypothetical protein n=1 Tax=Ciceribacter selenitireducens TaxID=448181 RepID=UPI00049139D8|nr:hypothetical protein [Ciceribacter selenitireducens]PPJ46891.1 hypothetical protein C0075_14860 [Rhizobium sp. KAs_5_22]
MLALLNTIRGNIAEAAETGTYADGALSIPAVELRTASRRDAGRGSYARDYGAQRKVQPDIIGYA